MTYGQWQKDRVQKILVCTQVPGWTHWAALTVYIPASLHSAHPYPGSRGFADVIVTEIWVEEERVARMFVRQIHRGIIRLPDVHLYWQTRARCLP